jgi:predicted glycoside hydrolase/deacetylase ChbG (UPF0249 family)
MTREARLSQRTLIFTADDSGLHDRVNEAVERAHLHGVLTAASLMVAAPAARDAVARARRLPGQPHGGFQPGHDSRHSRKSAWA